MNQKAYSILFCALLASTFYHEIRAKSAAHPPSAAKALGRAAPESPFYQCNITCNYPSNNGSGGVTIIANVTANLLVIANVTANVILVIDFGANLIGIFDGNTGEAIIINIKTKEGVYISVGVWLAVKIGLVAFVSSLTSLSFYLQFTGYISFTVSTASNTILKFVNRVVALLILNIGLELAVNIKLGLQIIISISTTIVTLFKADLKGFLGLIGTAVILTKFDLVQFVNFLKAFALIIVKISITLEVLIAKGFIINLKELFGVPSGVDILIRIIIAIAAVVDIAAVLVVLLDIEFFFNLIAQFGGKGYSGIRGLFTVIAVLTGFANGHVPLEIVIVVLIQFLVYNDLSIRIGLFVELQVTLTVLLNLFKQLGLEQSLGGLITVIKALINETFVFKNVAISQILKLLLGGAGGPEKSLLVIVRVLVLIKAVVSLAVSVPLLLIILIILLKLSIGINLLIGLGIFIDQTFKASGNLIAEVLNGIKNIITLLLQGVFEFLLKLSVIGKIVEDLDKAVLEATNQETNLKSLCNGSNIFVILVKGIFVYIGGIVIIGSSTTEIVVILNGVFGFIFGANVTVGIGGAVAIS